MTNADKLIKLALDNSNWLEEANYRQKNKVWLKHSQKIAISVLRGLREKNIRQKELAAMIGVSPQHVNKIVKGKGNLTLETISKLEQALGLSLIFPGHKTQTPTKNIQVKKKYAYFHVYPIREMVAKQKSVYKISEDHFQQSAVNENIANYG